MATTAQTLAPGAVLGAFRIVRFIARGGMGEVYEAENTITGARRALKVVRPDLLGDADMRARFVRETTLASHIKHPNVVEAWDPMLEGGSVVLPMELLEGESLAERLQRTGPLEVGEALDIVTAVAEAVAAFHERGVIHRDLKPGNVFLARGPSGIVPKVLDFGAARVLGDERQTMAGHIVGSPAYMAPEQAMSVRDLDGRVDVYALGVMLYVMLTGRKPYESDEHGSALTKLIQRRAFVPLEVLRSSVDERTRALVARALAWDRDARWPSMRELAMASREARAGAEVSRDSVTATPSAPALDDRTRPLDGAPFGARAIPRVSHAPAQAAPLGAEALGGGETSSVRLPVRSPLVVLGIAVLAIVAIAGVTTVAILGAHLGAGAPVGAVDAGEASGFDAGADAAREEDAGVDAALEVPDASARRRSGRPHGPTGLWLEPEPTVP